MKDDDVQAALDRMLAVAEKARKTILEGADILEDLDAALTFDGLPKKRGGLVRAAHERMRDADQKLLKALESSVLCVDLLMQAVRDKREAFTCPACGMISHHPEDKRQGWCGRCNAQTAPRSS